MEKAVLLLVVCLSMFVRSAPNESETVWLKDMTTILQTDKRKFSDPNLPDNLTFQLRGGSRAITLDLERNHAIDPNADVYFVRKSNDGRSHLEKALHLDKEELAYYQDRRNRAFMTVKCLRTSNGPCVRVINGNIQIEESNYDLQPVRNDVTSRDVFDAPDLGTIYVLRDQAKVQSEISVTHKDTTTVKVEQEIKGRLKLFPNGQKQFPFPSSTLVSRKRSSLHKRDKQKNIYYVEMAVVIEQGIYNFYSSLMMQTSNSLVMPSEVARKLREVYSHIINGVNLRYKQIEDPHIEIIVIPREFHIFQKLDNFSFNHAVVKFDDGKYKIDNKHYLHDLALWTLDFSKFSDHVMLFTRYEMYDHTTGTKTSGSSYQDMVCNPYKKTSIIMSHHYFGTVNTAAHELGHSLGAHHDGEGNAKACRADDHFLMSPNKPELSQNKPYSRHPWIFSNCSVEAFKAKLKKKKCLTNVGVVYDINEWNQIIQKMPGEIYSLNQQCEFINGHGSVFCGTVNPEICHFMKCTGPHWNICLPDNFSAHRGTTCGDNKWCQEGLCISKSSK